VSAGSDEDFFHLSSPIPEGPRRVVLSSLPSASNHPSVPRALWLIERPATPAFPSWNGSWMLVRIDAQSCDMKGAALCAAPVCIALRDSVLAASELESLWN
jgi:hypothetical protein